MSYPLPSGEVLNEAFQFGLRRWGTVLRFAWLPAALIIAILVGYDSLAFRSVEGGAEMLPLRIPAFAAFLLGVAAIAACLFLYAGFMASIFRLVALGEERDGFVHLRVDGPTYRVFWAVLIINMLSVVMLGVSFLFSLIATGQAPGAVFGALSEFFALAASASASGETVSPDALERLAEPMSVVFLSILGALIPLIYFNVRLAPFAAGSAVENRLVLFGAFQLTAGRFWAVLGVLFLVVICLFALSIIISLGAEIFEMLGAALNELGGVASLGGSMLLLTAFTLVFLYQIFSAAVQLSAHAVIYRRLKTGE